MKQRGRPCLKMYHGNENDWTRKIKESKQKLKKEAPQNAKGNREGEGRNVKSQNYCI